MSHRRGTTRSGGPAARRLVILGLAALAAAACVSTPEDPAETDPEAGPRGDAGSVRIPTAEVPGGRLRLELVADANLPYGSVPPVGPSAAEFGGISGLAWHPARHEYLAASDGRDRLNVFRVALVATTSPTGTTLEAEVRGVLELERATAADEPPRLYDLEALALAADGSMYIATEGRADEFPRVPPAVASYTPAGRLRRILPLPPGFAPSPTGTPTTGVRDNLGFESLALAPDGGRLIAAPESALEQDGPTADLDRGAPIRLVLWSLEDGPARLSAQYVYPLEPVEDPGFPAGFRVNGLAELLDVGGDRLLALERAFVQRRDSSEGINVVRLYSVSLAGATDVSGRLSLADGPPPVPVTKRLVLDLAEIVDRLDPRFPGLDNFEGMALGPALPDGSPTLVLVSDDNFSPAQRTVFLLFRIVGSR